MERRDLLLFVKVAAAAACSLSASAIAGTGGTPEIARQILDATGVEGGLVVLVGCGDGRLAAALGGQGPFVVQGLDADAGEIARARETIRSAGLYGPVSAGRWTEPYLPYAENEVNLVISEDLGGIPMGEVLRVLAPGGVAYVKEDGAWNETRKPRPPEIDEWTHYLHGPDGNAVAHDAAVGPPRRIQWVEGPRWARSHEHAASVSAIVSAGGRIFCILDEGSVASILCPARWALVARDAFNGLLLWRRSLRSWVPHTRAFRSGPPQLGRRLVAAGDRVYVTLGIGEPVTALDAATGRVVRTYAGTEGTDEILACADELILAIDKGALREPDEEAARGRGRTSPERRIMAVHGRTGEVLWRTDSCRLVPLTLAAADGRVFFQDGDRIACLDARTGAPHWRSARLEGPALAQPWFAPALVVYRGIVLLADGRRLIAFSAESGETLWVGASSPGYNAPPDLFVCAGRVWVGESPRRKGPDFTAARDPRTGEIEKRIAPDRAFANVGMPHHRCYRNRATDRYILMGRAGVEFIDLESGQVHLNHWIRGTCQFGILPCNGLLYAPPDACACFIRAKLSGFYALAPRGARGRAAPSGDAARLERGPAYGEAAPASRRVIRSANASEDWPAYRHDARRSGATPSTVSAHLEPAWAADLGGRLGAPVVAEGRVFIASVDAHTVYALDAANGRRLWSHTADGRVDSPPAVEEGMVIFGCADGRVSCLRASDGERIWRFRAAPEERRIVAFGQVESAWPVHGSVLFADGAVYFAAGRSSYLDGGIRLYRIDPRTGRVLAKTVVFSPDPRTGEQPNRMAGAFELQGARPDVLSADGSRLYMGHMAFDLRDLHPTPPAKHLFSPTGFLDATWFHRSYWIVGTIFRAGWSGWWQVGNRIPSGRILAFDADGIYGFGRTFYPRGNRGQWRGGEDYQLFGFDARRLDGVESRAAGRRGGRSAGRSAIPYRWSERVPLLIRAMVLAGENLFVAGPEDPLRLRDPAIAARRGARCAMWVISTRDGEKVAEYALKTPPVFDGMAAARGRLYLAMTDGSVLCFERP